jgi:hypothetical protein
VQALLLVIRPPNNWNSVEVECQPPREANLMNYFHRLHALCQVTVTLKLFAFALRSNDLKRFTDVLELFRLR